MNPLRLCVSPIVAFRNLLNGIPAQLFHDFDSLADARAAERMAAS